MHQQVGVAPNRRRKVRVLFVSQAKVAGFFGAIYGLLHGPQAHGLQYLEIRTITRLRQQVHIVFGAGVFPTFQMQAQRFQIFAQAAQFVWGGAFVYPIQARAPIASRKVGSAGIGRQHALFNQFMSIVALGRHYAFYAAQGVAHNTRLDSVEIDGTAPRTRFLQQLEQAIQMGDMPV